MPHNTKQDAINAAMGGPGWYSTGEAPELIDAPNTARTSTADPATIKKPSGNLVITVRNAEGLTDEITIKEVGNNPNTKGGVGFDNVKGPTKNQPAGSKPASPQGAWVRIDASGKEVGPNEAAVAIRDPNAPAGTQPFKLEDDQKLGDPKTWTPITADPNDPKARVIGLFDPKTGKVAASVAAAAGNKSTDPSKWQPVYRTPGKPESGIVGQFDPDNFELHPVSAAPDGRQVVITDSAIYVVDKDTGQATLSQAIDKQHPLSVVTNPDGSIYLLNPNEKDPNKMLTTLQGREPPQTMVQQTPGGAVTLVYNPQTKAYELPPGVQMPSTVDAPGAANLRWIITRDAQGNEITRHENPNWTGYPQPAEPTTSTTARFVPRWNKEKGVWEDVPNTNRLVASDALKAMAEQITGQVVAGDISEDEAYKLLTAANAKMANDVAAQTAAANAASTVISAGAQGAQTGAGLLNQRVQAAQGMLGQVLGLAQSGQSSGGLGGGLHSAPAGLGEALVGGIQGWATELGGGQGVYDTAARMVTAADPQNGRSPEAQAAYGVLTQMLERYGQQTGQPHPAVRATQAAQQSQQAGGMVAPATAPAQPVVPPVAPVAPVMAGTPYKPGWPGSDPRLSGILNPQLFTAPVTVAV